MLAAGAPGATLCNQAVVLNTWAKALHSLRKWAANDPVAKASGSTRTAEFLIAIQTEFDRHKRPGAVSSRR